jgi:predicted  nucleic acid-binding Zn-ribbon protein
VDQTSVLNHWVQSVAGTVLSAQFTYIWCGATLLYALGCTIGFLRSVLPIRAALRRAAKGLELYADEESFANGFESYRAVVDRERHLKHQWQELVESLVFPEQGSREPLRNTADPGQFLSDSTLIEPNIHTRFFNSVPSQLTALGILGTFVGLAAGIGMASKGLTGGDSQAVTKALGDLLNGASLAFFTSIFGITSSLLFLIFERGLLSGLHRLRQHWVSGLERRLRLVTLEKLGLDQLREAKGQSAQLKSFNTDLVFALEQALEEKVAGKLAPHLEKLIVTVEGLRQDRSTDVTKALENMMAEFTAKLTERTGNEFDTVRATLAELASTLRNSSQRISEDLTEAGMSASSRISSSLDGFREGMQSLQGASTNLERLIKEMALLTDKFGGLRETIAESHRHVQAIVEPSKGLAGALQESSAEFRGVLLEVRSFVQEVRGSADSMRQQQELMASAWEAHENRFKDIDVALANSFREMNEALERYTEKTREFAQSLDLHTGKALQGLGSVAGELSETLDGLEKLLPRLNGDSRSKQ